MRGTSMTISIAMATYNGAAHLQEQLDSLAAQTRLPHELVIGDDGSTDETLAIARRFAERAPFAVMVHSNAERLGYANNFLAAAGRCSGDWIAFCDQDDVWLPHKLATVAGRCNDDTLLVLHSADLTDGALRRTGRRFPDLGASRRVAALHNRPWWTPSGFTQCVSGRLLRNFAWNERPRDFNYPDRPQAHDQWTYFLANSLGNIAYIEESLALYRRHDAAVTGSYQSSLGNRLQHIRAAGRDYYACLAGIAGEYAQTLRRIAPADSAYARESAAAQAYYARLRETYRLRAELHSDANTMRRLSAFAGLCRRGAYAGMGGKGLGIKAFVKDVAALA